MSVVASHKEGDTRERIIDVGRWFGRTFYRDGRSFTVKNERVWIKEEWQVGWEWDGWSVVDWRVLPRDADKEGAAVAALMRDLKEGR